MLPSWVETWLCTWLIMTLHFLGTVTSPLVRSTLSRERSTANHLWCLQIVFCLDVQRLVGRIPLAGWNLAAFSTLRRRACHEALWWQRSFATGKTCASLLNGFECFVKAECAAPFEVGTLSWTAGRGLRRASRWARCGKATHTADAKMQRVFYSGAAQAASKSLHMSSRLCPCTGATSWWLDVGNDGRRWLGWLHFDSFGGVPSLQICNFLCWFCVDIGSYLNFKRG